MSSTLLSGAKLADYTVRLQAIAVLRLLESRGQITDQMGKLHRAH
jgi:hypothetical protein